MNRDFVCILCPNGCDIETESRDGVPVRIEGNLCPKGEEYVRQELLDPRRTISSSVLLRNGVLPLASVRLTAPIPRAEIGPLMEIIRKLTLDAPVQAGQVLMERVFGYDSNLIVTRSIKKTEK